MNLPDAQQRLWQIYREAERVRVRQDFLVPLREFIESLTSLPTDVWHPWARELARQLERGYDIPVRLPLFRSVLFPALHAALLAGEAEPARLLAGPDMYLGLCPECREALPENLRTERGLYEEAIRRDPTDSRSKSKIRKMYRARFEYALHELPDEVLYGTRAATVEQCIEMLEEIDAYRRFVEGMPDSGTDTVLISQATVYINAYREYLAQHPLYGRFSDYLEAHGIGF